MIRHNIFRVLARIPVPLTVLGRLTRTRLLIPYYHSVSDETLVHVKHLYRYKCVREFTDDLDCLLKNYSPMGLIELLECIKGHRSIPERVFMLTFDDGYREMSDIVAPILLKKGINATFFVNSAFINNQELCYLNKASVLVERLQKNWSPGLERKVAELLRDYDIEVRNISSGILSVTYQQRDLLDHIASLMDIEFRDYLTAKEPYLTSTQINGLIESGFTIGAHSIDHPMYSSLSLEDQLHQTIESVKFVRELFHLHYGVFAFPFSDHGISKEFFSRLSGSGLVDLSFGTAGLIDDSVPSHLQRFSLEKPLDRADRIIAFQYARKLRSLITGNSLVVRR